MKAFEGYNCENMQNTLKINNLKVYKYLHNVISDLYEILYLSS